MFLSMLYDSTPTENPTNEVDKEESISVTPSSMTTTSCSVPAGAPQNDASKDVTSLLSSEKDELPAAGDEISSQIDEQICDDDQKDFPMESQWVCTGSLDIGLVDQFDPSEFLMEEDEIVSLHPPYTWSSCPASSFNTRIGPDYVSGQKASSLPAMYEVFAVDGYSSPKKIHNFPRFVKLQPYIEKYFVRYDEEKWPLPPIICINVAVPGYMPPISPWSYAQTNGEGWHVVHYAHITQEIVDVLNDFHDGRIDELPPYIDLFARFLKGMPIPSTGKPGDVEMMRRFKGMGRLMNVNTAGWNYFSRRATQQYNGTPFLTKYFSRFYHEPGQYFSVDLDMHLLSTATRAAIHSVRFTMSNVIYDMATVIQGEENHELPERILVSLRMSKVGVERGKSFPVEFWGEEVLEKTNVSPIPIDEDVVQKYRDSHWDNIEESSFSSALQHDDDDDEREDETDILFDDKDDEVKS